MAAFQLGGIVVGPVYMLQPATASPVTVDPRTPKPITTRQLPSECRQAEFLFMVNLLR
jgi:hypothetical protein